MKLDKTLYAVLENNLPLQKARVKFIALFVLALIKTPTVNFAKLALALNSKARIESNYRRIQRFFAQVELDSRIIGRIVFALLPQKTDLVISIDRTEWKSGSRWINLFVASVVVQNLTFPLVWFKLPGQGSSNTDDRIDLMNRVLDVVPKSAIAAVVGDREFIGYDWFRWLSQQEIIFYMRVKIDAQVASGNTVTQIKTLFEDLRIGEGRRLGRQRSVYGNKVWISGMRLKDDYLIIASNQEDMQAFTMYKKRWGIECLFESMKTGGFNLESTHVRDPERIERLFGMLTLAYTWAQVVGQWLEDRCPRQIKKHGRAAISVFRYGLDQLQMLVVNADRHDCRRQLQKLVSLLKPAKKSKFQGF